MFNWGDLEKAKSPIGSCGSGEMSLLLMRKHTHTHACSLRLTQYFTVNTASAALPPSPAWISTPGSCVVMLPSPKPFMRSKELKPVLRKRMGKWLGKARVQRKVIQLQGCCFPRVLPAIPLPRFCPFWLPVSRIQCILEGLKHLFLCYIQNTCWLRTHLCFWNLLQSTLSFLGNLRRIIQYAILLFKKKFLHLALEVILCLSMNDP